MGLKLIVGKKDRIIMSNGVIIEVLGLGKRVTLEFEAPKDIKIHTIFNDPSKQFKNLQADNNEAMKTAPVLEGGQSMSVEDQINQLAKNMSKRK